MQSAVLLIIYKRESTTRRVFERIREVQPSRLYIAANAPNPTKIDDVEKCEKTRKCTEQIDWPCEVKRWYRDEHLSAGISISSAITWFFNNEEQGIILEDDILPHPDFFKYCDEMLERYRKDERIQLITGRNSFFETTPAHECSYFFSKCLMIWGWASWRRVWQTYEFDLNKISQEEYLQKLKTYNPKVRTYLTSIYKKMLNFKVDTWDHQFFVNQVMYDRYSIIPFTNMVENLGMGSADSTHSLEDAIRTNHKANSPYPLVHPREVIYDDDIDYQYAKNEGILNPNLLLKIFRKIRSAVNYFFVILKKDLV